MPHTRYKYKKQEKYEQCKLYLLSLKYKKALVKYEGYSLGYLDSNQEWMNQNHLCCQLHHTPRVWTSESLRSRGRQIKSLVESPRAGKSAERVTHHVLNRPRFTQHTRSNCTRISEAETCSYHSRTRPCRPASSRKTSGTRSQMREPGVQPVSIV